jgi:hypothetical protein
MSHPGYTLPSKPLPQHVRFSPNPGPQSANDRNRAGFVRSTTKSGHAGCYRWTASCDPNRTFGVLGSYVKKFQSKWFRCVRKRFEFERAEGTLRSHLKPRLAVALEPVVAVGLALVVVDSLPHSRFEVFYPTGNEAAPTLKLTRLSPNAERGRRLAADRQENSRGFAWCQREFRQHFGRTS